MNPVIPVDPFFCSSLSFGEIRVLVKCEIETEM